MKSEKGITLSSLVIYMIIATAVISSVALLSSNFYSNMYKITEQSNYTPEFNKFSMFFSEDVKNNKSAEVSSTKVTFEDGTIYEYKAGEKAIYRNKTKISEKLDTINFSTSNVKVNNTTKQIINVKMEIEGVKFAPNGIEYVLKYW